MASHHTFTVFTGLSNTGFNKIATKLVRRKFVMKNPPHTAHSSLSRLKECRLVLSGTQALPLWNMLVLEGKYTLEIYDLVKCVEKWRCIKERDTLHLQYIYHIITPGYSPKRPQVYCNIFQPHPHPFLDHQTGEIEAQRHCGQGAQGPRPGGGG